MSTTVATSEAGQKKQETLYEVLGVAKTASSAEIKKAYHQKALQFHPDKFKGSEEEEAAAADKFKRLSAAYAILSDPAKRRKYDASGQEEALAMEMEAINLADLGFRDTLMAAMLSKLGVAIPTSVPQDILDKVKSGEALGTAQALPINHNISGRVDKGKAHFFRVKLSASEAAAGVAVRVFSSASSKYKLLHFDGSSELKYEVDSADATTRKGTTAEMYFVPFEVQQLSTTIDPFVVAEDPAQALFRRLDSLVSSTSTVLSAGDHLFGIYGNNFFKRATYTIEAVVQGASADFQDKIRAAESALIDKKAELATFENDYLDARRRFQEAQEKYEEEAAALEEAIKERERLYTTEFGAPTKSVVDPAASAGLTGEIKKWLPF